MRWLRIFACGCALLAIAEAQRIYTPMPRVRVPRARKVTTGEVKLKTEDKTASVYIDGGFAGKAEKLKKIDLRPGKHLIEVKDESGRSFKQRVYVTKGKTVEVVADLK